MELGFLVFLLLAAIWVYQFTGFMLLEDRAFPGVYDKLIWAAAFLLLFPLTPFAFMFWKMSYLDYVKEENKRQ